MKTLVSLALLVSMMFATVSSRPRQAEALVGAITLNGSTALLGAAMMGGGLVLGTAILHDEPFINSGPNGSNAPAFVIAILCAAAMPIGLIVLDDHSLSYAHLPARQARSIGLSGSEWRAYESELPEIGAISQQVASELKDTESAKSLWIEYGNELSKDALSAVQKISEHAVRQALQTIK
jgi:hypothetical protein